MYIFIFGSIIMSISLFLRFALPRFFSSGPHTPISVVWLQNGTYRRKPAMRLQTEEAVVSAVEKLREFKLRKCWTICKAEIRGGLHVHPPDTRKHVTAHLFNAEEVKVAAMHVPFDPARQMYIPNELTVHFDGYPLAEILSIQDLKNKYFAI